MNHTFHGAVQQPCEKCNLEGICVAVTMPCDNMLSALAGTVALCPLNILCVLQHFAAKATTITGAAK